jgi:16S rRNA (adenine1518-N6/adenine1519-N6)-dimethyltransferase
MSNSTPETSASRPPPAKKSLGQHFLADRRIVQRILDAAEIGPQDTVLEIGPGRGVMTRLLAERAGRVIAVELDHTLAERLAAEFAEAENVRIVEGDAREVDIGGLVPRGEPYKVVANLPYYAASPIVRRLLETEPKPSLLVVMVQREVAQSMAALPGDMTILSVATQLYGRPRIVCSVPPRAFRPAPKVTSAVVRIDVYERPCLRIDSEAEFFELVRAGFSSRRKQIHNPLSAALGLSRDDTDKMLNAAGIDATRRAQTLSMEDWGRLYEGYRAMENGA